MTDVQVALLVGLSVVINTALSVAGLLFPCAVLNQRLSDLKEGWCAELRRLEVRFDTRLRHLENVGRTRRASGG